MCLLRLCLFQLSGPPIPTEVGRFALFKLVSVIESCHRPIRVVRGPYAWTRQSTGFGAPSAVEAFCTGGANADRRVVGYACAVATSFFCGTERYNRARNR